MLYTKHLWILLNSQIYLQHYSRLTMCYRECCRPYAALPDTSIQYCDVHPSSTFSQHSAATLLTLWSYNLGDANLPRIWQAFHRACSFHAHIMRQCKAQTSSFLIFAEEEHRHPCHPRHYCWELWTFCPGTTSGSREAGLHSLLKLPQGPIAIPLPIASGSAICPLA